jgi:hypothetical protein
LGASLAAEGRTSRIAVPKKRSDAPHERYIRKVLRDSWDTLSDDSRFVFVLGAGFSRAVSEHMPLTDELGRAALRALRERLPPRLALEDFPAGLNFETWLSQLASEQPYLSDTENAENRSAFLLFSAAIADELGARVTDALAESYPEWLLRFVSAAHHTRAGLVTFNYDPLIECLVATPTGILGDPNQYGDVWEGVAWAELTGGLPARAPGAMHFADQEVQTLRLLKLHGSLNWYWRPGDTSGVSVARRSLPGHFGAPKPYTEERRRRDVPGRSPFVVPPSASKSEYYSNPITMEMWRQAAERLRNATHVVFMGYSLPVTDVTFSNMLRETLSTNTAPILVVDYMPKPVRKRLVSLGLATERISIAEGGSGAIDAAVTAWTDALSALVARHLQSEGNLGTLALISWGDRRAYARVAESSSDADGVVLSTGFLSDAINAATGLGYRETLTVEAIAQALRDHPSHQPTLRVRCEAGGSGPVVAALPHEPALGGQGLATWQVLQVAASPPATPVGGEP